MDDERQPAAGPPDGADRERDDATLEADLGGPEGAATVQDAWSDTQLADEGEEHVVFGDDEEEDAEVAPAPEGGLKERVQQATGALPEGLLLKVGGAVAVLAGALVFLTFNQRQAQRRPSEEALAERARQETVETAALPAETAMSEVGDAISQRVDEERQAQALAAAAERAAEAGRESERLRRLRDQALQAQRDLTLQQAGLPAADPYAPGAGGGPLGLTVETEAIQTWREEQRIEELRREARAPWADPLALDLTEGLPPPPPPAPAPSPAQPASDQILEAAEETRSALQRMRAELIERELGTPPAPDPAPAATPQPDAGAIVVAGKGRGNRVIREGSLLPAILTTALDSRAPGPAIAMISRPVHSRDRLEVLIPRGAKALGSFSVQGRRLAVNFRTLQFQDGRSVALDMLGMDPSGSRGLADSVNMHYAQRIGAVGLIGMLTALPQALVGRSSRGSAYGPQGISTVGQQVGTVGTQALQPMIGRPPTIRVRPGAVIRIYIQSDLEIP